MRIPNIGVVGLGWPGQQHATAIKASTKARLYAGADTHTARREEFAAKFRPDRTFDSYEAMLADPSLDGVVIALPNFLHFKASLAALEAGKHVLCEKPPTLNAAEMTVLCEEAQKRDLIYFFGRQSRFSPEMLAAKKLISDGVLGDVYFAKAIWIRSRGTPVGIGGWFTDKSRSGGGALIDIGVHAIDAAWYLMGNPNPVSVSGQVFNNFRHLTKVPIFDVEDSGYGMIRFDSGALVHFEVSWAANLPDDIPESGWTGRELINTVIYGSKGTLQLNPLALFQDQNGEVVKVAVETTSEQNAFFAQMENFLDAIAGAAAPINNAAQAVYLMEMLDSIYRSSRTGREIPIA